MVTIPFSIFQKDVVSIVLDDASECFNLKSVNPIDFRGFILREYVYERSSDGVLFYVMFEEGSCDIKGRGWGLSKDDNGDIILREWFNVWE